MLRNILIIAGPTGSGKSAFALTCAQELDGVIINADSVQMYNGLPILTAQPTQDEQQDLPHRLYATLDPADAYDAEKWRQAAITEINQALENNKTPIIVGGTGFYIAALTEGFSPIPDVPEEIRMRVRTEAETVSPWDHLNTIDPIMAARLNPNDTQRLIRAWEIFEATGKSLAHFQSLPKSGPPAHLSFTKLRIDLPRDTLYDRINTRFHTMMDNGALNEVTTFRTDIQEDRVPANTPLKMAHGYLQLCAYLDGTTSLDDAIAASQQITRNYAKRQTTWLKHRYAADMIVTENTNLKKFIKNLVRS